MRVEILLNGSHDTFDAFPAKNELKSCYFNTAMDIKDGRYDLNLIVAD